jgi:hypothetical protein
VGIALVHGGGHPRSGTAGPDGGACPLLSSPTNEMLTFREKVGLSSARRDQLAEVASPLGRRMAGHRMTKGEPGVAVSGAAPARLRSTAAQVHGDN